MLCRRKKLRILLQFNCKKILHAFIMTPELIYSVSFVAGCCWGDVVHSLCNVLKHFLAFVKKSSAVDGL